MGDVTGPLSDGLSDQEREQPGGRRGWRGGRDPGAALNSIPPEIWGERPCVRQRPAPTCLRPMAPGPLEVLGSGPRS